MDSRKPLDGRASGLMLLLCLVWGIQQVVLKVAAPDVTPLLQIALRSGVAAILVGVLLLAGRRGSGEGEVVTSVGTLRPGLVVGFLFALEFLLIGEGLRHTTASHMVVFLYSAPIFAALGLHWRLPSERLAFVQWAGIALAFGGIAVAFLGRGDAAGSPSGAMLWGDFLGLLAGVAWGSTTVAVRCTSLARASAKLTLLYQLVAAFVLLTAAAAALGQLRFHPTPIAWASLAFHSLVVSFASFLIWFWLLRHYLASRLGVFSFLTPLFGVLFGAVLLQETIEPGFAVGAALVIAGIVMVSGYGWLAQISYAGIRARLGRLLG